LSQLCGQAESVLHRQQQIGVLLKVTALWQWCVPALGARPSLGGRRTIGPRQQPSSYLWRSSVQSRSAVEDSTWAVGRQCVLPYVRPPNRPWCARAAWRVRIPRSTRPSASSCVQPAWAAMMLNQLYGGSYDSDASGNRQERNSPQRQRRRLPRRAWRLQPQLSELGSY
jgi:hypothetical protein